MSREGISEAVARIVDTMYMDDSASSSDHDTDTVPETPPKASATPFVSFSEFDTDIIPESQLEDTEEKEDTVPKRPMYTCDECQKLYSTKMGLKVHRRTHTLDYPYKCHLCTRGFNTKTRHREHLAKHANKPFATCRICRQGVSSYDSLKAHNALHASPDLLCDQCEKHFHTATALRKHKIIHTDKDHECNVCGKYFHKELIYKHLAEKHGEKKFKCELCEFATTRKGDLKRHGNVHDTAKLEICRKCGKAFKLLSSLKRHELICKQNSLESQCSNWEIFGH